LLVSSRGPAFFGPITRNQQPATTFFLSFFISQKRPSVKDGKGKGIADFRFQIADLRFRNEDWRFPAGYGGASPCGEESRKQILIDKLRGSS
jgi:hypothetical protein